MQEKHDLTHSTKNIDFPLREKKGRYYIPTAYHLQKVTGVVFKPGSREITSKSQKSVVRY